MKELDINFFPHSSFVFALFSHRQIDKISGFGKACNTFIRDFKV